MPWRVNAERKVRSVDRVLYRPQGDVTLEAICSPENAKRSDDTFNGDGSQYLGNRFRNDIVRFLEAAGVTERGT